MSPLYHILSPHPKTAYLLTFLPKCAIIKRSTVEIILEGGIPLTGRCFLSLITGRGIQATNEWACPTCKQKGITTPHCPQCGAPKPPEIEDIVSQEEETPSSPNIIPGMQPTLPTEDGAVATGYLASGGTVYDSRLIKELFPTAKERRDNGFRKVVLQVMSSDAGTPVYLDDSD